MYQVQSYLELMDNNYNIFDILAGELTHPVYSSSQPVSPDGISSDIQPQLPEEQFNCYSRSSSQSPSNLPHQRLEKHLLQQFFKTANPLYNWVPTNVMHQLRHQTPSLESHLLIKCILALTSMCITHSPLTSIAIHYYSEACQSLHPNHELDIDNPFYQSAILLLDHIHFYLQSNGIFSI